MKIKLTAFLFLVCVFAIAGGASRHAYAGTMIKNYISSTANSGGNSASNGGSVITAKASAKSSIKVETGGESATSTVDILTEVNGKKEEVSKTFTGGAKVDVEVSTQAGAVDATTTIRVTGNEDNDASVESTEEQVYQKNVEFKNITISRVAPEQGAARWVAESILSALKSTLAYVVSFFL